MNGRTQIVDLVPRSNRFYGGMFLAGAAIVGLLEVLYAIMPLLSPHTTDGRVATFDLDSEGSLAVWVSSFTLLAAAGCCLLIYVLQSETKQPRRIWLWAACCWTIMSIDECSSLHEAFKEMMSHLTGERISHDGTLWWVLAYFCVLSTTGIALLRAMRKSPASIAALFGVAGFYAVAVSAELSLILPKDKYGVMVEEGCEMLGNFALLTSMGLFAKHAAENLRRHGDRILEARFQADLRLDEASTPRIRRAKISDLHSLESAN
ncbi:MAG: hypothetical protein K8U03_18725 [Planctomycetia bacterium]|nr:hypothetical protein [Planctomycetia bacterium]